jgi:hypothetical protein
MGAAAGYTDNKIAINWDEFDKLVAYQCTQQEIADFFDVDIRGLT